LKLQLEREREFNRDLQLMLKTESEERRKLTALLTHQQDQTDTSSTAKKTNSLFLKIFKR
jgi:cellobiose-specific phosphotransferase system component IIA